MAINKRSRLDDFTRGSDALWHTVHMAAAGVQRLAIVTGVVALPLFAVALFLVTNSIEREVIFKHYLAELLSFFGIDIGIKLPIDGGIELSASQAADITGQVIGWRGFMVFAMAMVAIGVGVFVARKIVALQMKLGEDEATDNFLRGQKLVSADELAGMTNKLARSGYKVGSVGIPDEVLPRNAAFIGSMGVGKTVGILDMLDAARDKTKAVIYDYKGDFIEKYYDPARGDVILNPMDMRSADWSVFDDMVDDVDYLTLSRFIIPDADGGNGQNQIFVDGARLFLQDVMKLVKMCPDFEATTSTVAYVAMRMPLAELHKYLVEYELNSAEAMTPDNVKLASSIRVQVMTAPAMNFFKLFTAKGFSINEFIKSDSPGWLFLSNNEKHKKAVSPFVAMWLELAVSAALSLEKPQPLRLLLGLDELATLPKLDSLHSAMTVGREYGICTLLGFQNVAQGQHIYGQELFKTMLANAQTKVIFRTEEIESAKALAEFLGAQEVDEATAGKTHSSDAARDSSQIGRKRVETTLVMPSELLSLENLTAYLKVSGAYPVAKVTLSPKARPNIAKALELRPLPAIERREPVAIANDAADADAELHREVNARLAQLADEADESGLF